ncbi:RNA pyrophosphohydrolase [Litorimonas haliclonae]|uniref:RNA pyrophosphohydrolase n=1 Tax=Litorimonas haliclonae TaxID=2081977 RepID=UPI0039EF2666
MTLPSEAYRPEDYRPNVGAAIFNAQGQIWLGKRFGEDGPYAWQCAQGGIDDGEDFYEAALRELWEETGIRKDKLTLLGRIEEWLYYDFTEEARLNRRKREHKGQRQRWFAFRYHGDGSDIDLCAHGEQEFSDWKWADLKTIHESVVPFKRGVYERLIAEFADFANPMT